MKLLKVIGMYLLFLFVYINFYAYELIVSAIIVDAIHTKYLYDYVKKNCSFKNETIITILIIKIIIDIIIFQFNLGLFPLEIFIIFLFNFCHCIYTMVKGKSNTDKIYLINDRSILENNSEAVTITEDIKCPKCGASMKIDAKFCPQCGEKKPERKVASIESFDKMYQLDDTNLVLSFIEKQMNNSNIDFKNHVSKDYSYKKNILNSIFAVLIFVLISMIFFHFPLWSYIIGIVIIVIYFIILNSYSYKKYLKRKVIARPGEKVLNIIMSENNDLVKDFTKKFLIISSLFAVSLSLFIFRKPIILYEKVDNGYAVRYYIFGLSNMKSATIPEKHNGLDVVSLRGNTFSNMPFLTDVSLPNTITEIRGQAFKNDISLVNVNIPNKLEYLGGGVFYNCDSIVSIELPDTLTYLGGESFYGASSLESIKLSTNLTEIRGNTFENCTSLKEIKIPDKVTRIGGHAFYGDTSLSKVEISISSKLEEIGSSAFRNCDSLANITIPNKTVVNQRAFKNSPTIIKKHPNYYGASNE